ncbi:GDP-mannose 4,6-dehydratase [Chloroflexota bacterium]
MKKCLITGCGGFIGSHLAEFFVEMGFSVYGIVYPDTKNINHLGGRLNIYNCNIMDKEKVLSILEEVSPDYVFHLAAQSLPYVSWRDIENTFIINVVGTIHLLEGIRKIGLDPLIVIACSSDEYGYPIANDSLIKESDELCPSSPYGVSKLAEDMLSHIYWQAYGMKIIRIRPFTIVGPRKVSDVCSDFASGIAEIENGESTILNVGNLDAIRDFVDIKDAVQAIWLLVEKGASGQVYNICSGKGYRIKDILNKLIALSSDYIVVHHDPSRMRPSDKPYLVGDNSKLRALGWEPTINIEDTLSNILSYCREHAMINKHS